MFFARTCIIESTPPRRAPNLHRERPKVARFELDSSGLGATLDLHGYKVETALEVARGKVREAWENGCLELVIIHGWGASRTPKDRQSGTIGQALREQWEQGEWSGWVHEVSVEAGRMRVRLRGSGSPSRTRRWSQIPAAEFSH